MADDSEESVDTDPETNHETESGDDTADNASADTADADEDEKSFRERVEEIRQRRAEERESGERPEPDEMMGGGGGGPGGAPGGMGGMGGGGGGGGAVGTEGIDGASDAAGGIVDAGTLTDEAAREALARHDAASLLADADALIRTGPTGTNVNDLRAVVVEPDVVESGTIGDDPTDAPGPDVG